MEMNSLIWFPSGSLRQLPVVHDNQGVPGIEGLLESFEMQHQTCNAT
jgi:hypothetical protein